jgi:hypothetical protein
MTNIMKTFLSLLFVHFETISYPASSWFSKSTTTEKKNSEAKRKTAQTPSPESYNVRGRFTKKSNTNRRTMAP